MLSTVPNPVATRLTLGALSAGDLMAGNPVSLHVTATVPEATALLADRGFSAAPVIDDAGRPVGVVSKADILIHDRELGRGAPPVEGRPGSPDTTRVEEIMTPAVFSVTPETPVAKVVEDMLKLNVQQLFVVDAHGTLVGIISTLDVLRHLQAG